MDDFTADACRDAASIASDLTATQTQMTVIVDPGMVRSEHTRSYLVALAGPMTAVYVEDGRPADRARRVDAPPRHRHDAMRAA